MIAKKVLYHQKNVYMKPRNSRVTVLIRFIHTVYTVFLPYFDACLQLLLYQQMLDHYALRFPGVQTESQQIVSKYTSHPQNMGFLALFLYDAFFFVYNLIERCISSSNHCPYSVTCFAFSVSINCPCLSLKLSYSLTPLNTKLSYFHVTFLSSTPFLGWPKVLLTPSLKARHPSSLKQT